MASEKVRSVDVVRVAASNEQANDIVAIEEPLEIACAWNGREHSVSVTMRTPGDDFDLAVGFLFSEALIREASDIESVRHWGSANRVRVALAPHAKLDLAKLDRHFYATSSCGVCGKTSIDALRIACHVLPDVEPIDAAIIRSLPEALRNAQTAFDATGGVHGAALFDRAGALLRVREDIGRHNAVDKLIGSYLREGAIPRDAILMVSSRGSFELVQKAIVANIPTIAFIGGPSSLAIELAREFHVTLLGFVRDGRFNVYAGSVR